MSALFCEVADTFTTGRLCHATRASRNSGLAGNERDENPLRETELQPFNWRDLNARPPHLATRRSTDALVLFTTAKLGRCADQRDRRSNGFGGERTRREIASLRKLTRSACPKARQHFVPARRTRSLHHRQILCRVGERTTSDCRRSGICPTR